MTLLDVVTVWGLVGIASAVLYNGCAVLHEGRFPGGRHLFINLAAGPVWILPLLLAGTLVCIMALFRWRDIYREEDVARATLLRQQHRAKAMMEAEKCQKRWTDR